MRLHKLNGWCDSSHLHSLSIKSNICFIYFAEGPDQCYVSIHTAELMYIYVRACVDLHLLVSNYQPWNRWTLVFLFPFRPSSLYSRFSLSLSLPHDTWQKTLHLFVAAVSSRQYSEDIQKCLLYRARQRKRGIEACYLDFWPHPEFPVLHLGSGAFSNLWSKVHHLLACSGNQPLFTVLFWQLKLFCPRVSEQGQRARLTQQIQNMKTWYHLTTSSEILSSRHIFSRVQSWQHCRQSFLFPWIEKAAEILQTRTISHLLYFMLNFMKNFASSLFKALVQKTYTLTLKDSFTAPYFCSNAATRAALHDSDSYIDIVTIAAFVYLIIWNWKDRV